MVKTDLKQEFKKLCLQIESCENQLNHIFIIKEKDIINTKIKDIIKHIDNILDEYNMENIVEEGEFVAGEEEPCLFCGKMNCCETCTKK